MLIDYEEPPLQSYDSARSLTCNNDRCPFYGKTIFRVVRVKKYIQHRKILWLCGRCRTQQILKESNY